MPFSFSSLVSLTELHISVRCSEEAVDFGSIGTLPNLSSLYLSPKAAVQTGHAFEQLTKLTNLYIGHESCLHVTWHCHMSPMLKDLRTGCRICEPVPALFSWAVLPCLTKLSFNGAWPSDKASMFAVQAVGQFMVTKRPDVLHVSYWGLI